MDKDFNKLKKTILLMKKEGVLRLKTAEGIEINFDPSFLGAKRTRKRKAAEIDSVSSETTDDEAAALLWSTNQFAGVTNG